MPIGVSHKVIGGKDWARTVVQAGNRSGVSRRKTLALALEAHFVYHIKTCLNICILEFGYLSNYHFSLLLCYFPIFLFW